MLIFCVAVWAASCEIPVGPGYSIEQQNAVVRLLAQGAARVELRLEFTLRNSGDVPLRSLEIHLPPGDGAHLEAVTVAWEGQPVGFARQPDAQGDILRIQLGEAWPMKKLRTLRIEYTIASGEAGTGQFAVTPDFLYLPPDGWLAAPVPPRGMYARGGAPPKEWTLEVQVPGSFAVQAAGERSGQENKGGEQMTRFRQRFPGMSPYVIAGLYTTREFKLAPYPVEIWRKTVREEGEEQRLAGELSVATKTYDAVFGARADRSRPLWIADDPAAGKEPAPPDFAFTPVAAEGRAILEGEAERRKIAESLSKGWLGYGLGPDPQTAPQPMGSLPGYAGCLAREAARGPGARREFIEEGLRKYAEEQTTISESGGRAEEKKKAMQEMDRQSPWKNLLFFFALEDQFGRDKLHAALQHMIQARRGRGYDLRDLLAALEQETSRNVGEFVRGWVKHPGIAGDFRARYGTGSAQ
ncbi:MAG: hypothetical protein LAN71_00755 [Acidobacteriia bacterium]|nr:hypothetical protein [Terriglobia bacterium]